ncbi:hypothetical protein FE257_005325 [Aspergillus nanangensis]|uniref:Xylanolytic transcriptional activator regulatory domain-containing protein n=1 Tax=Aspergillus nanangensis TaxID=2582783 RepID=A0AAD4GMW8_ASPNN|nr:hypothetical protein FE257_005325 [Aspergillus nanangensis]
MWTCLRQDKGGVKVQAIRMLEPEKLYFNSMDTQSSCNPALGDAESIKHPDIRRFTDRIRRLDALTSEHPDINTIQGFEEFSSMPLSIFEWTKNNKGVPFFDWASMLIRDSDLSSAKVQLELQDISSQTILYTQLPSPVEIQSLLETYLRYFNPIFPLFQEGSLRDLINQLLLQNFDLDAGSKACAYMVIALSYKLQLGNASAEDESVAKAWFYFDAASRFLCDITIAGTSLRNVQALAAMSIFLQGSIHFNNTSRLLEAAIRQGAQLDQNHDFLHGSSNMIYLREFHTVRCVLYILDKENSMHSGLPPIMKLCNQSVEQEHFSIPLPGTDTSVSLLQHFYTLATIEEQIYQELYSVQAQGESAESLLDVVSRIDERLDSWQNTLPIEIKAGLHSTNNGSSTEFPFVYLQIMYNNCLITIHRLEAIHCPYTGLLSRLKQASPAFRLIRLSAQKRARAAQESINICERLRINKNIPLWLLPPFVVTSEIIILISVILDLEFPVMDGGITVIDFATNFLVSVNDRYGGEFDRLLRIASGIADVARRISWKGKADSKARWVAQVALENSIRELQRGLRPRRRRELKNEMNSTLDSRMITCGATQTSSREDYCTALSASFSPSLFSSPARAASNMRDSQVSRFEAPLSEEAVPFTRISLNEGVEEGVSQNMVLNWEDILNGIIRA